jgi:DNA-binding response OmpR family regulator
MISALLVDDEPRANEMMRRLLAAHAEIEIVGVAENAAEARHFLEATPPDVVFLDIDMPGDSGLDLLVSVPDATQVVFVTASDKHAVRAFAAAALDYLVKPVDPERLADTVARVRRHVAGKSGTDGPDTDDPDTDEADAAEVLGARRRGERAAGRKDHLVGGERQRHLLDRIAPQLHAGGAQVAAGGAALQPTVEPMGHDPPHRRLRARGPIAHRPGRHGEPDRVEVTQRDGGDV